MTKYKYRHREIYKDVTIDIKTNDIKELMSKLELRRRQIDRQTLSTSTKLLDFSIMVIETYKKPKVSSSWYDSIEGFVRKKIVPGIGNRPIGKIKPMEIETFLNSLSDLSDSHIKKIFDITKLIFSYAYKNGLTPYNYSDDFVLPRGKKGHTGRSITDRERAALLQVLPGHRGELFCKLMLYCGLRPGEVCALQWKDIDFTDECVIVDKALKKDGSIGLPKTESGIRIVPIPRDFLALLQERKGSPFDLVCPQLNGKYHTHSSRVKMWKSICRKMNIAMGCRVFRNQLMPPFPLSDDFTMYNLRHTYCTDLEKSGVPINIARRLMGHASIETTSNIYTHDSKESFEIAKNLINNKNSSGKTLGKQSL